MDTPPRHRLRTSAIIAAVLAALVIFGAGVLVGGHPQASGLTRLPSGIRGAVLGAGSDSLAGDIENELKSGYYTPVDTTKLTRASIDGMLASLHDPYTYYLDPTEYAAMQRETQGLYVGVGIQVLQRGADAVIVTVFANSPAQRAGLAKGDVITAVNGVSMIGKPLNTVTDAIRGAAGTPVTVTVRTPTGATVTRAHGPYGTAPGAGPDELADRRRPQDRRDPAARVRSGRRGGGPAGRDVAGRARRDRTGTRPPRESRRARRRGRRCRRRVRAQGVSRS